MFRRTPIRHSRLLQVSALAALLVFALPLAQGVAADRLTVFAAASLKEALDEVAAGFAAKAGHDITVSAAGSSALARQIQHGAPADIFISASPDWMDALERDGLIEAGTRFDLLRNEIVLIAHGAADDPSTLTSDTDIAARLGDGRLAMALVDAVPAGIYGKAALTSLGLWASVAGRIAQADNVRAALTLVALGEAALGIVYATDAAAEDRVGIVGTFPADSHPPIVYPAAALTGSAEAVAWLDHLRGAEARAVFRRHGFLVEGD